MNSEQKPFVSPTPWLNRVLVLSEPDAFLTNSTQQDSSTEGVNGQGGMESAAVL